MENPIDDLTFIQEIATSQYGKLFLTSKQGSPNQYCTKIINKNQIFIIILLELNWVIIYQF